MKQYYNSSLVILSSPYSIWGNLGNRTVILLELCKEIIKVDYFKCTLIPITVQKHKRLLLISIVAMTEGQDKLQEKADMLLPNQSLVPPSLYNLFNRSCQVQYNLFLIRLTSRERVMGRKRQSSRNPSQDESSNLVLRGNYFYFFEYKKKKIKTGLII